MKFEVVSHIYSGSMAQYWQAMCYQLTALEQAVAEGVDVTATVFCCPVVNDPATHAMLDVFAGDWLRRIELPKLRLYRRSIGRNMAALATAADVVLFTDCDYVWPATTFRSAEQKFKPTAIMSFARFISMHRDPVRGDAVIARLASPGRATLPEFTEVDWMVRRELRGIGGNQWVDGDYCRKYGYLNSSTTFQADADRIDIPFWNFRDDASFRRGVGAYLGISGRKPNGRRREFYGNGMDLPGVARLRHVMAPYKNADLLLPSS